MLKLKSTLSILLLCMVTISFSQDWKLEKDKNGIKVYARKIENIEFSETKTIATLNISKDKFIDFIWDVENYPNWEDEYELGKIIESKNKKEIEVYFEFNAPWPVKNRDVVINMKEEVKEDATYIYIKAIKSKKETHEDIVRMNLYDGYWKIKENNGKTNLTFQILANPSGNLPSFLVEFYKASGPYNHFMKIKNELIK